MSRQGRGMKPKIFAVTTIKLQNAHAGESGRMHICGTYEGKKRTRVETHSTGMLFDPHNGMGRSRENMAARIYVQRS